MLAALTMVPDGVLGGVDLWPLPLLNPGQGCGSGPLGSFTGPMTLVLGAGAALRRRFLGLRTASTQRPVNDGGRNAGFSGIKYLDMFTSTSLAVSGSG